MNSRGGTVLFGGSFDPIHRGHIAIAEQVFQFPEWSRVLFIPTSRNPLKGGTPLVSNGERLKMVQLAVQKDERFAVSDIELRNTGSSYTYDTVRKLQEEGVLGEEPGILVGDDVLSNLHRWYNAESLLASIRLVVALRSKSTEEVLTTIAGNFGTSTASRIQFLRNSPIEVSSTEVRRRLMRGESYEEFLDPSVTAFIKYHGLYSEIQLQKAIRKIEKANRRHLSEKRLRHIERVREMGRRLAHRFGVSPVAVDLLAVAHDMDREIKPEKLLRLAKKNLEVTDLEIGAPKLLHGPVAAWRLHEKYGITDRTILQAVRHHTRGDSDLDEKGLILFISDYTETGRPYLDDETRSDILSGANLAEIARRVIDHSRRRFNTLDPKTEEMYRSLGGI